MTLEEIKALQKEYGYEDIPLPQFAKAIAKKYGSFTSLLQAFPPANSIVQGVKEAYNAYSNATQNSPWNPQNISEGYKQIANSSTPMATYEQGAMGLLGHELTGLRNTMMNMYQDPMNLIGLMGGIKNVTTPVRNLLRPEETQLYGNLPKEFTDDEVLRMITQDRIGNKIGYYKKYPDPDMERTIRQNALNFTQLAQGSEIPMKIAGYFEDVPQMGLLSKAYEDIARNRYMNELRNKTFPEAQETAGGFLNKRMAEYYKNMQE